MLQAPDAFFRAADLPQAREAIRRVAARGEATVELELVTKPGAPIPFEYSGTLVELSDGVTGLLAIGRDLTARRETEAALRGASNACNG